MRRLRDSVVVVTGASSGIGRAASKAFANKGATVVAAARREQPLWDLAREVDNRGRILPYVIDVTDAGALRELASYAVNNFGRLDVWVNNAAVTSFGRLEDTPREVFRRVIETDLFGYIEGARVSLPEFRRQGSGVLINNASIVALMAQPYTGAYSIAKHGVRALGMNLRQELLLEGARDIHVCTIMPAVVDTPLFQHAANYTGREAKTMPPVYPAEKVANAMVRCARRPRREVIVGNPGRVLKMQTRLAPGMTEGNFARATDKQHLYQDRPASPRSGNVFEPVAEGSDVGGGWLGTRKTRTRRAVTLALGAAAALWVRNSLGAGANRR